MPLTRAAAILLIVSGGAAAAPCSPDALEIDRGETRRVVICADTVPERHQLTMPAGIAAEYQQRLRHCAVGDRRPGLQLVLRAGADAASGPLLIADAATNEPACDALPVNVPDRRLLPAARLASRGDGGLTLQIDAPGGIDLSGSCEAVPDFPASDGLTLESTGEPTAARCSRSVLRIPVRALDQRRGPAKVILQARSTGDGSVIPAVAYAKAPDPHWLGAMPEADARFLEVGGVRTRYFEKGKGEALVLVHGGQPSSMDGTAWDWQQNFDALANSFRVYALDRIGQGYTDNPADLDEYRDYYPRVVAHLLGFMDAMGLRRAHLVGHSQGSWPVTRIALDQPDRVASLTLVDGTMVAPSRDGGSAVRFYLYLSQDLHPGAGETLESARRGMELFSFTRNNLTDQRVARIVEMARQPKYAQAQAWFAKSGMSPAHPSFRALKQQALQELEAGKLRVPVLIVWGQNDPEGSLPSGLDLFRIVSASSPRARLHVFGRSGHLSFIEYPEEFNEVLTGFALGGEPAR
jgi:2-hydroxy-6-oxo-6-(2'-carboxyphenyl)-hexa-2,4-dienoate hydrolase